MRPTPGGRNIPVSAASRPLSKAGWAVRTPEETERPPTSRRRPRSEEDGPKVFSGGGEMAARIEAHDWRATPLGPIES